mmetsp:Transcript_23025/g.61328  ORF Transcript_23025/g.61328 Transcript_23025/m.61328 type:complete len:80 (-) Transcript_23025:2-241(-)
MFACTKDLDCNSEWSRMTSLDVAQPAAEVSQADAAAAAAQAAAAPTARTRRLRGGAMCKAGKEAGAAEGRQETTREEQP